MKKLKLSEKAKEDLIKNGKFYGKRYVYLLYQYNEKGEYEPHAVAWTMWEDGKPYERVGEFAL